MASIRVTGIRVRRLWLPLPRPLATRVGEFAHGPFLAIDLETQGGDVGRVLGFTFSRLGLTVVPPVLEHLATLADDRALTLGDLAPFHDSCQKSLTLLGHEGVVQMALSMFDMALYDAMARAHNIPLYALLGGQREDLATYNSTGLGLLPADQVAGEAEELRTQHGGYSHIKMRLGRERSGDDVAALRAVRAAVGPGIDVSVDFNQGLIAADALSACRAIDDFDLAWIEEPVVYDDYDTQRRLTAKLRTPHQTGENWWSWRVGRAAIETNACDYIMPDILRIGGVTGWLRLARVAEQASIPFSSHLSPDYSAHVLAATPTRHWLEYMDWGQLVLKEPLVPVAGRVQPRDAPGAGLEWDERELAHHIVDA
ncbi:MAG: enolase C-terminal domain-like protein [Hyphomicrobiaceae bacterium]